MSGLECQMRLAELPESCASQTLNTLNGVPMKRARYLLLEESPTDAFVYRYAADWEFAGDTWHANIDDAVHQLEYEFGATELAWRSTTWQEINALTSKGK